MGQSSARNFSRACSSVALRIIVDREKEVKDFVPTQWFSIQGNVEKQGHI